MGSGSGGSSAAGGASEAGTGTDSPSFPLEDQRLECSGPMDTLRSHVKTGSAEFQRNRAHHEGLVADLRRRLTAVANAAPPQVVKLQRDRGKLLVRERIERLLDPDTPFLEFSPLAATGLYDDEIPAAGIITGIGVVSGRECVIVANDATVKGGTYYPITIKKHIRAQEIALENRVPAVYLVDSGGVFLPLQAEVFPDKEQIGRA